MYPGLFTIWITSLGAFPMLPVGSGITPGCKGLFQNIHPSKSSNLALSETSAPEGARQYHRNSYICTWTSWTKDVLRWRGRHSCLLRAAETWAFRQTSTPNSPAHFSCLNKGWLLMSNVLLHSLRLATHPLWRSACSHPPEKGAERLAVQQTWPWLRCWSFMPGLPCAPAEACQGTLWANCWEGHLLLL